MRTIATHSLPVYDRRRPRCARGRHASFRAALGPGRETRASIRPSTPRFATPAWKHLRLCKLIGRAQRRISTDQIWAVPRCVTARRSQNRSMPTQTDCYSTRICFYSFFPAHAGHAAVPSGLRLTGAMGSIWCPCSVVERVRRRQGWSGVLARDLPS